LLQHLAYPGTVEFACRRWCHSPLAGDDLWFLYRRDGQLAGSCRLLHRRAKAGDDELVLGGIGNVCSHPDARGIGAAKACMLAAAEYMLQSGKVDFGMLFCRERVVGFYRKVGWREIENDIVSASRPRVPQTASPRGGGGYVMIHPGRKSLEQWPAGAIDLNGEDW
jgi:aminoglycoside 2'-N-acetyltransferase I